MPLSKMYYEMISEEINYSRGLKGPNDFGWDAALDAVSYRLAERFMADNYRFSRGRFLRACGVKTPS